MEIECRIFGPAGYSSHNISVEYDNLFWLNVLHSATVGGGSFLSAVVILTMGLFIWSRCHTYDQSEDDD